PACSRCGARRTTGRGAQNKTAARGTAVALRECPALLRAARTGAGAARGGTCAARSGAGAGGRAAGRLALAAHFDVDATVGLQAGDQLRVGLVALALIARHGLAFAAAFRAHLALL